MAELKLAFSLQFDQFMLTIDQVLPLSGITGIFGHSASGKSTLLRALAGLTRPDSGQIIFNQQTLFDHNNKISVKPEKRRLSLVFQDSRLFPHLTVQENLDYAGKRCQNRQLSTEQIMTLTELQPLASKNIQQLSGGEQQRVALARALLAEPELLLLDEPLSALDKKNKALLLNLLTKIQQTLNIPVLYVSHSLAELQQVADKLLVMSAGQIVNFGNIHQVIHQLNSSELIHHQTSLCLPITQHSPQYGLSCLSLTEQQPIYLPLLSADIIDTLSTQNHERQCNKHRPKLRCFILASDISITLTEPIDSSIVNHLPGTITAISHHCAHDHSVLITVTCFEQPFFVHISELSCQQLALQPGLLVFIQFKAGAVRTFTNVNGE